MVRKLKSENNIERKYHHYLKWEDYKFGMYDNPKNKIQEAKKICDFFKYTQKLKYFMFKVVHEWKYSCEQNLTNPNMNKIAYIGQAAVALALGFSRDSTMFAWNLLDEKTQDKANKIAEKALQAWVKENA
jgi:hypothetical protein